jgi:hypothetical protein
MSYKIMNYNKIKISRKVLKENRKARKELIINSLRSLRINNLAVFARTLQGSKLLNILP